MNLYTIDVIEGDYAVLTLDKVVGALLTRYRFRLLIRTDNYVVRSGHLNDLADAVVLGHYLFRYYERFQSLPPEYADPRG